MYYCGIDVAKRKHVGQLLDEAGQKVGAAFSIENTRDGFERLLARLKAVGQMVRVALEATGHYWLALYEMLMTAGYAVVVFNPLQVAAYRRSGLRKRKTDRSDALWIADYLRVSQASPTTRQLPELMRLKELSRFRHHLAQVRGDRKRKVVGLLDRVFPEYERLFSDLFLVSSRRLLSVAASAQQIARLELGELTALLSTSSHGHFGEAKAQMIQAAARRSVGVGFLADAVQVEMQCLLAQLDLLEEQCAQVEAAIQAVVDQLPQHILTLPGVGLVTGAVILAEIGDVNRFDRLEKLVAYAGIDATVYQTGEFEAKRTRMSKRGSPYLRAALWQAASMALRRDAELTAYYDRKRAEGKHHGAALGAVMRKLLARIYVILREQRPYVVRP